jgi:hypothetical protein
MSMGQRARHLWIEIQPGLDDKQYSHDVRIFTPRFFPKMDPNPDFFPLAGFPGTARAPRTNVLPAPLRYGAVCGAGGRCGNPAKPY